MVFILKLRSWAKLKTIEEKQAALYEFPVKFIHQIEQMKNPQSRVLFEKQVDGVLLENLAIANQGVKSGDDNKWRRTFWEIDVLGLNWRYFLSTVSRNIMFSGRSYIIDWSTKGDGMIRPRKGNLSMGRKGVAISQMGGLPCTLYLGELYDSNVAPIVPKESELVSQFWSYFTSKTFKQELRKIDSKKSITNATFLKVPYIEPESCSELLEPYSDDPTQWLFHGHPAQAEEPLQVAVARLLGYQWPAEADKEMELSEQAQEWIAKCERELIFVYR